MIEITINYDLLLNIILIMYFMVGVINLFNGVIGTKKYHRTHNGATEIIAGLIGIGICIGVIIL